MRHVDGILVSTSPPMCSFAALLIAAVRRVPIVYWVMDINPDQAVALGRFRTGQPARPLHEPPESRHPATAPTGSSPWTVSWRNA